MFMDIVDAVLSWIGTEEARQVLFVLLTVHLYAKKMHTLQNTSSNIRPT